MGNLSTPGVIKLLWKNDILETQYETIHQIPVITIDKQQAYIPPPTQAETVAILHYNDSKKSAEVQARLKDKHGSKLKIYAIPNQNSKQNFQTIRTNNTESLGKMTLNGHTSHPLFKYLKKNCPQFYNYGTNSSQKNIGSPIGLFLVTNSTDGNKTGVIYYGEEKLAKFVDEGLVK